MTDDGGTAPEPGLAHPELADVTLYALGACAGASRNRVRVHIAGCALCRDELVRITGVRTLLGRLAAPGTPGPVAFVPPTATPPPVLREQVLNQVLAQRRVQARRRRRAAALAAAAALAVAAVPTTMLVTGARHADRPVSVAAAPAPDAALVYTPMQMAAGMAPTAAARAAVTAHPWGTGISVEATDFVEGTVVNLFVVPKEGSAEEVGSWQSAPGTVTCTATTWYPRSELSRVEARKDDGTVVASRSL